MTVKDHLTVITRKGQITLPADIRRVLGVKEGDKVSVSLSEAADGEEPQVILKPVRSVAEMTFGAVPARKHPEDFAELRRFFEEGTALAAMNEIEADDPEV